MSGLQEKMDVAYTAVRSILDTTDEKGPDLKRWMTLEEFNALEKLYWECHMLVEVARVHVDPNSIEEVS